MHSGRPPFTFWTCNQLGGSCQYMKDYRPSIALSSQMVLKLRKASQHLLLPQDSAQHSTESFKTYDAGTWRLKALEKSFFSRLCSIFSRLYTSFSELCSHSSLFCKLWTASNKCKTVSKRLLARTQSLTSSCRNPISARTCPRTPISARSCPKCSTASLNGVASRHTAFRPALWVCTISWRTHWLRAWCKWCLYSNCDW